jgi:hypothetical protein
MSEGQKNNTKNDRSGVRAANAASRTLIDLIDSRIERYVALKKQNKTGEQNEEEEKEQEVEEKKVKAVVPKKKRENAETAVANVVPQKEEEAKTKKPKIKEDGWVCEGNLLEKTPCPLTEDKQIVSTDTRYEKKLHNTCKHCKGVMKKARKQQKKSDE